MCPASTRWRLSLPHNQHPVGAVGPDGPHDAFGVGGHPRALRRQAQHLDPLGGEDRVEPAGELPGPIPDEVPHVPARSVSIQVNCRAAPTVHSADGCAVTPGRWTNRVRTSMTK